jgi:hypothetical protein
MSAVNLTAILVVALAVVTIIFLVRKRYDSNLPLLFYFIAITFTNAFDRPVNPYIVYTGLVLALVLRFEFMGKGFTKFVAFCATSFLVMVIWDMMSVVLSS